MFHKIKYCSYLSEADHRGIQRVASLRASQSSARCTRYINASGEESEHGSRSLSFRADGGSPRATAATDT